MSKRNLTIGIAAFAAITALSIEVAAQDPADRFGRWQMDSNAPPPSINIMTYEAWGDGGMKITVASTNRSGESSEWGYATLFDTEFRPVTGQNNRQTSVEFVNERTTRITNMMVGGRVTQVIINTLSEDGNTIENEYVRFDDEGKISGVGHATYRRIQ